MGETYVYLEADIIKGFISVIGGEFIGALFVDVDSQGKGIGKQLIDYAKGLYNNLALAVYKKNEGACEFYKKVGFIIKNESVNEDTQEVEYTMGFTKVL